MKQERVYSILIFLIILSISCDENPTAQLPQESLFRGRIEGWHSEGYDTLDLQVRTQRIAQAPVDSTGQFETAFPFPVPPDSLLRGFFPQSDSNAHWQFIDGRTFSDTTAGYARLNFVGYTRHHIGFDLYAGNNFLLTDSGTAIGDFTVSYFYFNKPTKLTGSCTRIFRDSILIRSYKHTESVTSYNLDLKMGWNAITTMISSDDPYRRIYSVSTGYPSGTTWFIGWTISHNFELASQL